MGVSVIARYRKTKHTPAGRFVSMMFPPEAAAGATSPCSGACADEGFGWNEILSYRRGARMKRGTCPKCGSATVYLLEDGIGSAECQYIKKGGFFTSSTTFDCYLCVSCGFFENYVNNRQHLETIAQRGEWKRVPPHGA